MGIFGANYYAEKSDHIICCMKSLFISHLYFSPLYQVMVKIFSGFTVQFGCGKARYTTEFCGVVINTPASYLRCSGFSSWPGDQLSCLRTSVDFLSHLKLILG